MQAELDALQHNRTWELVLRPPRANVISSKWVFKQNLRSDGTLKRYKARWVVQGFRQRASIDFMDTFAPVIKLGKICNVLHLAATRAWPVHQMDVSNAFLHGHLSEQVYCEQPTSFVDATHLDHVCPLSRCLYELKQAPRAWYQRITAFLHQLGFRSACSDASLFVYQQGTDTAYLLLHFDAIILTTCTTALLQRLTASLHAEFAIKDLGPLHYFLGIEVVCRADGFFLH
jgi:histone deacetylase 1/2